MQTARPAVRLADTVGRLRLVLQVQSVVRPGHTSGPIPAPDAACSRVPVPVPAGSVRPVPLAPVPSGPDASYREASVRPRFPSLDAADPRASLRLWQSVLAAWTAHPHPVGSFQAPRLPHVLAHFLACTGFHQREASVRCLHTEASLRDLNWSRPTAGLHQRESWRGPPTQDLPSSRVL